MCIQVYSPYLSSPSTNPEQLFSYSFITPHICTLVRFPSFSPSNTNPERLSPYSFSFAITLHSLILLQITLKVVSCLLNLFIRWSPFAYMCKVSTHFTSDDIPLPPCATAFLYFGWTPHAPLSSVVPNPCQYSIHRSQMLQ